MLSLARFAVLFEMQQQVDLAMAPFHLDVSVYDAGGEEESNHSQQPTLYYANDEGGEEESTGNQQPLLYDADACEEDSQQPTLCHANERGGEEEVTGNQQPILYDAGAYEEENLNEWQIQATHACILDTLPALPTVDVEIPCCPEQIVISDSEEEQTDVKTEGIFKLEERYQRLKKTQKQALKQARFWRGKYAAQIADCREYKRQLDLLHEKNKILEETLQTRQQRVAEPCTTALTMNDTRQELQNSCSPCDYASKVHFTGMSNTPVKAGIRLNAPPPKEA